MNVYDQIIEYLETAYKKRRTSRNWDSFASPTATVNPCEEIFLSNPESCRLPPESNQFYFGFFKDL